MWQLVRSLMWLLSICNVATLDFEDWVQKQDVKCLIFNIDYTLK